MSWFVYIDYKPTGEPFYVGKGNSKRVACTRRNNWHTKICKKYPDWIRERVFAGSEDECFALEKSLIAHYGRRDLGLGPLVNMTDGGEGASGLVMSDEAREKIGEVARRANSGRKQTPESRARKSASLKGRQATAETRAKLSAAQTGKKRSEQAKQKLRDYYATPEGKRVRSEGAKKSNAARKAAKLLEATNAL